MADPGDEPIEEQQPDQAALAVVARHALHDEELIAAFAGGDLEADEEADRARALTERCPACRDLHRDVQLIDRLIRAAETAAEYGARVKAPRDFRLTVDDAIRSGGPAPVRGVAVGGISERGISERGLLERIRTTLAGVARPLGASMATLGLVGLLVGSMTFGSGAMPGAVDHGAPSVGRTGGELIPVGSSSATGSGASPGGGPRATGAMTSLSSGSTDDLERSTDAAGRPTATTHDSTSSGGAASSAAVLQAGSFALLLGGLALLLIGLRGSGRGRE